MTARKRSLGQGNIFTPVCHSVHGGRCLLPGGVPAPGGCLVWGVPGLGGAWSGGVCSWGVCSWGCLVPEGCLVETPQTATAAGSTHPSGMDSCVFTEFSEFSDNICH